MIVPYRSSVGLWLTLGSPKQLWGIGYYLAWEQQCGRSCTDVCRDMNVCKARHAVLLHLQLRIFWSTQGQQPWHPRVLLQGPLQLSPKQPSHSDHPHRMLLSAPIPTHKQASDAQMQALVVLHGDVHNV